MTPIRADDRILLTDKGQILGWSGLPLHPAAKQTIDEQALQNMPQRPLIPILDESPTREKAVKAINQLQTGKAQRPDRP